MKSLAGILTASFAKKALAGSVLAGALYGGASVLAPAEAAEKFKVAWVYLGPTGDTGWNYQQFLGQQAVEKEFGDKVETVKVENVPEGADAERVLTQLARSGAKMIFCTSFGYMEPALKVAKQFPNVYFEHATGYKTASNVSTYNARYYEGAAVQGVLAGKLTKSGIAGFVGSVPIPEVIMTVDAFTIALRKVRPDATVKVIWLNEWFDPGKEAEATKALMDLGADVITQSTDSPAPVQTAEARGVYAFGTNSDMAAFGPTHLVTSTVDDWASYDVARVKAAMNGTWKSEQTWGGMSADMLSMAPVNKVLPADVAELAAKTAEDLKSGKLLPFAGPIKDQTGKVVVPEGQSLSDEKILGLNWYVQGIDSQVPK